MKKIKIKTNFFKEFREFISQGNIIDMAVGVVIGTAFKAIVSSLVADIVNPCIALITGDVDLKGLKYVLVPEVAEKLDPVTGEVVTAASPEVAITYGVFLQSIIDFLLIAICIFIVIKVMMTAKAKLAALAKKKEAEEIAAAEEEKEPEPSEEAKLLIEIRDLLKEQK